MVAVWTVAVTDDITPASLVIAPLYPKVWPVSCPVVPQVPEALIPPSPAAVEKFVSNAVVGFAVQAAAVAPAEPPVPDPLPPAPVEPPVPDPLPPVPVEPPVAPGRPWPEPPPQPQIARVAASATPTPPNTGRKFCFAMTSSFRS